MPEAKMKYFLAEKIQPPDENVRLVLAWTSDLPGAKHFWTFAFYKDGKWTENRANNQDLTDTIEYWCEVPTHKELRDNEEQTV